MSSRQAHRRDKRERVHDQRRGRARATTAWRAVSLALACAIPAVLLVVLDASLRNVFDLPKAAFSHALGWLLLGALLLAAASDGLRIPRSPLFLAFYAVIAVELVTTATAENRYVALYGEVGRYLGLTTHLVLALVAVAIAVGADYPRRAGWLGWTLAGSVVAVAGYALLQAAGADPVRWADLDPRARPFGTLGNPDFYGQLLSAAVIACFAVALFGHQPPRWLRAGVIALGVLSGGLLVMTQTRGAVIGAVGGAVVLGVIWLRRTGATRGALARLSLAGLALAAALGIVVLTTPLGDRLVAATELGNVKDRVLIYSSATRIFLDHPLLGVGFENFAVAYPRYAEAYGVRGNQTQTSAHNWLLHLAATTGLAGLAATAALLIAFAAHVWQRARDADAAPLLAAAGALTAFYASGLVLPGAQSIQWIPWVCVGVALASDLRSAPVMARVPPVRVPLLGAIVLFSALGVLALLQGPVIAANRSAKVAETSLRADTAERAVQAARAATAADPGRAVYWNDLGRALELVGDRRGALDAYREATRRSPYTPAFWWNLGRMHVSYARAGDAGEKAAAYRSFARALEASPRDPDTYDQLARAQLALGDLDAAIASGERAVELYPGDWRFYTVPADAARLKGEGTRSLDYLRAGVAATGSNDLRLVLARRLVADGSVLEARAVLREILRADPQNAEAISLLGQVGE